jgi:hypothetical protein
MGAVTIGADIGQKIDPTAIAVAESEIREDGEEHFLVRHLERLPLLTPYPKVAGRVAAMVANLSIRIREQARLDFQRTLNETGEEPPYPLLEAIDLAVLDADMQIYCDATGVGAPIVDLLRVAGVPVIATYFTHGDHRTVMGDEIRLGKGYLVSRLQALAQADRLHLPNTNEATAMKDELLNYEIKVDRDGDAKFGAFKTGKHDDMVTALGLAVQVDREKNKAGFEQPPFEMIEELAFWGLG